MLAAALKLHDTYQNDLEDTMFDEMVHFSALLRSEKIGLENDKNGSKIADASDNHSKYS